MGHLKITTYEKWLEVGSANIAFNLPDHALISL